MSTDSTDHGLNISGKRLDLYQSELVKNIFLSIPSITQRNGYSYSI